jgi:hypothetical protein
MAFRSFRVPNIYGLFTLHLTQLSAGNERKGIEGIKVRLRAIKGSSKKEAIEGKYIF